MSDTHEERQAARAEAAEDARRAQHPTGNDPDVDWEDDMDDQTYFDAVRAQLQRDEVVARVASRHRQDAYNLVAADFGEPAATCVCGCGVRWHFAPADPCCRTCDGYRWDIAAAILRAERAEPGSADEVLS